LIRALRDLLGPQIDSAEELLQDLRVPKMHAEHRFFGLSALRANELRGVYLKEPVPLPAALESVREIYLNAKKSSAAARGETVDNNKSYSLHGLSVNRPQDKDGHRQYTYTITVRPTDFFHFVFPNLALDENISLDGRTTTARAELGLSHDRLRIENLGDFACHFRIGTGTVLVTSDEQVVISLRSRHQFIVGGEQFQPEHS